MNIKLEAIKEKYHMSITELAPIITKLYKKELRVPKTKNKVNILLEDLRLYIMANDKNKLLQNYYNYEIKEAEEKILERYDNATELQILTMEESKKLFVKITGKDNLGKRETNHIREFIPKEVKA